jgi:hypothetical protein
MTDDARLELAAKLLQEAVYQARARSGGAFGGARGGCGLGPPPEARGLELTEHGRELFATLFPVPPSATRLARIAERVGQWVGEADALDRERNHFLRAFRTRHGFDRRAYSPAEVSEFEAGLQRVNEQASARLRAAAGALLEAE